MLINTLMDLMKIPGISGNEKLIRNYMNDYMIKYNNFDIVKDKLGSIFAYKKSKTKDAKTLMIAGHMDEVGLMVGSINPNGTIKVIPIGGLLVDVFISQIVYVYTSGGKKIPGVIGSLPPHLHSTNSASFNDLILDIGVGSKDEVINMGVNYGDMILFDTPVLLSENKEFIFGKAIDNRYGCALALDIIKHFNDINLPFNLVVGATVQEEVGLRGAETSAKLINPDMFIALDASPVNDLLDKDSLAKLGEGFLLRIYDPRNVMTQSLKSYFTHIAITNNIKYQNFISMGGTDAAKTLDLNSGIVSTTIGLPARYIHSTCAVANLSDIESAKEMIYSIINDLTNEKIDKLQKGVIDFENN